MTRIAMLVVGVLLAAAARAGTDPVIAQVAAQLDRHPLVMLGELHRSRETHAFLQQMLRDPSFICRIDDVVVESGNARLQALADTYVSGGDVSAATLQSVWRETAVPLTWNSPLYRHVFETVRAINQEHLCPKPVRVLLGDPPLDWSTITTPQQYARWTDRDGHYAGVVERDVLAKGHRALLIAGELHAMKAVPTELQDDPPTLTVAQILERDHPGALFSIATVPSRNGARALGLGASPSFAVVQGTPRADVSYQFADWDSAVVRTGESGWTFARDKHWPRVGSVIDGLLYLGGNHSVYPSPRIYLDPAYQRELRRRAAIIKAYSGQDFGPKIGELVREGRRLQDAEPHHENRARSATRHR